MKLISGAIMLLAAEQAYAHSQLIGFPNSRAAGEVLWPAALFFLIAGMSLLLWGIWTEVKSPSRIDAASTHAASTRS